MIPSGGVDVDGGHGRQVERRVQVRLEVRVQNG